MEIADAADPESVTARAGRLADERISILINNAGVAGPVAPLVDIEPHEWDEVFAGNVRGVVRPVLLGQFRGSCPVPASMVRSVMRGVSGIR